MLNRKLTLSASQLIAILLSLLLIILGTLGLVLLQKPLRQTSFDTRQQAAEIKECNELCNSNTQCAVDHFCYQGRCRLANNPSSDQCQGEPDHGLNRACDQYCADSRECASNLVCLENRCRRLDNSDDINCLPSTQTIQEKIVETCGDTCSSHADCELNMRCYGGVCRLASNPANAKCQTTPPPTPRSITPLPTAQSLPKGGAEATLSGQPSATQSATPVAVIKPTPTPKSLPKEETALDTVINSLRRAGLPLNLLPILTLGLGGVILLAVLIPKLSQSHASKKTKKATVSHPNSNQKSQLPRQQELQKRLNQLKQQQESSPIQSPPIPPTSPLSPQSPLAAEPASSPLTTEPTSPLTVEPTPPTPQQSNMLSRLKTKDIKPPQPKT